MAVIGCDIPVRQVVGAEKLADARAGIWTKTHFYEKGPYLYAKTFLVAAGEPSVLVFRIDLRPLEKVAARIHQRLHEKMVQKDGGPVVGFSFAKAFKSIKKTAKKIGKSKLVKSVGHAIKTVAKSKFVGGVLAVAAVAVPVVGVATLAAYGAANAAIKAVDRGKKLVHTAETARRTLSTASTMSSKLVRAKAQAPARASATAASLQARANATARQIAAKAKAQAASQASITSANAVKAQAAARARATLAQGRAQAASAAKNVATQVKAAEARVVPVVKAAATLQAKLSDPAVRARLTAIKNQADSAKKTLAEIKDKAKYGRGPEKLDAQKSAAIVNLVARNQARIQAMSQVNAGGLPSLLIDARGRIVPGRYRIVAQTGGKNPDVLYKGPKTATERGAFAKVAGSHPTPFPPPPPREQAKKDAAYLEWLQRHAPKPATVSGEDDDALTEQAEISGHLKPLPQTGEVMPPGARVRFFLNGASHSGKILQAKGGQYTISYRPKGGVKASGKKHLAFVPKNDVYAVDARSIRTRNATYDRFSNIGFVPAQHLASTVGAWGIGCDCEGSLF